MANSSTFKIRDFSHHLRGIIHTVHTLGPKLALSAVSLIATVYAVDFMLLAFFPTVTPNQMDLAYRRRTAQSLGVPFDMRTKLEMITDLRESGVAVFPSITAWHLLQMEGAEPTALTFLPVAGISNVTTVLCNEAGDYVIYESDRYGFRNPSHAWATTDVDIMLVGDSFTHGYCVDSDADISGLLRKMGYTVTNLGMFGTGPLVELASIIEYAHSIKPKNVTWLYFEGNDMRDLGNEKLSPILLKYLDRGYSQGLISKQTEIDRLLKTFSDAREREEWSREDEINYVARFLKLTDLKIRLARITATPDCYGEIDPLFGRILEEAKEVVSSWGGRLYFVYLPEYRRYYYANTSPDEFCNKNAVISLVAEDLGIPVIDIDATFANHPDPLSLFPLRIKGHYTEEGYRLVAQQIRLALEPGAE
jgi:hypothetical protein